MAKCSNAIIKYNAMFLRQVTFIFFFKCVFEFIYAEYLLKRGIESTKRLNFSHEIQTKNVKKIKYFTQVK